jgi:hypothetical protein
VLAPFDVYHSLLGAVGAWLVAVLVGVAIGLPVYAFSAGAPDESSFALVFRLGVIPQFLFSGAFFPIGNLSPLLETIARLTPLYQGVDLARMLTLGTLDAGPALVHLAYLLVMAGRRPRARRTPPDPTAGGLMASRSVGATRCCCCATTCPTRAHGACSSPASSNRSSTCSRSVSASGS